MPTEVEIRDGNIQALQSRDDEIKRLRKGIQDYINGNYGHQFKGSKLEKCPHGCYRHESCEGCIDNHFLALLAS